MQTDIDFGLASTDTAGCNAGATGNTSTLGLGQPAPVCDGAAAARAARSTASAAACTRLSSKPKMSHSGSSRSCVHTPRSIGSKRSVSGVSAAGTSAPAAGFADGGGSSSESSKSSRLPLAPPPGFSKGSVTGGRPGASPKSSDANGSAAAALSAAPSLPSRDRPGTPTCSASASAGAAPSPAVVPLAAGVAGALGRAAASLRAAERSCGTDAADSAFGAACTCASRTVIELATTDARKGVTLPHAAECRTDPDFTLLHAIAAWSLAGAKARKPSV